MLLAFFENQLTRPSSKPFKSNSIWYTPENTHGTWKYPLGKGETSANHQFLVFQPFVSTHLKNIHQIGSFHQVGVKQNIWNHHPNMIYDTTVDGRNPAPVDIMVFISHYLRRVLAPSQVVGNGISEPSKVSSHLSLIIIPPTLTIKKKRVSRPRLSLATARFLQPGPRFLGHQSGA